MVRSSRREALLVLAIWTAALGFSVFYCNAYGYGPDMQLKFVLGVPEWVFWGVIVPWLACTLTGIWFANVFMRDDPLGRENEIESDIAAEEQDRG